MSPKCASTLTSEICALAPVIPVFVISLPDCTDRRARIARSLNELGLKFEFVDAVDGRHGLPPEYEGQIDRVATRKAGRCMSDAEYACALSHINVYRMIVARGLDYALILEDDNEPLPQLRQYLLGKYYEDADLTQLKITYQARQYVRRWGAKRIFGKHRSYLRVPKHEILNTSGYIVSGPAARHFIENAVPVTKQADWPDCIETLVARRKCRVVHPPIVGLSEFHKQPTITRPLPDTKPKRRFLGIYVPPFKRMVQFRSARRWLFLKCLRPVKGLP